MKAAHFVVELEIWSAPGAGLPVSDGHELAAACVTELGLPGEWVLGLSHVPADIDVQLLKQALAVGELLESDFQQFCLRWGLVPAIDDMTSASLYLADCYGLRLAWLHLPCSARGGSVAKRVRAWVAGRGLQLCDPDELSCPVDPGWLSHYWPEQASKTAL